MSLLEADFSNSKVMIIDGSPLTRGILASQLREFGFRKVTQCTKLAEAREQFSDSTFDVVMCEHNFAGETPTGIDLIDELREKGQLSLNTVFFMLTGEASYNRVAEAAETGLDGYLLKPHKANQLHERLRLARYRKDAFREVFDAMEVQAYAIAADLCLERYRARSAFWLYAARVGAELLMRVERFTEAQELYEAIAAAKAAPWAKLGVARAMMASGDPVAAASALGALIAEDPSFADAYDVMARAQFELGNVAQAQATYKMACDMTPDSVPRLQNLAMMTFYAGDIDGARPLLDRVTRIGLDSKLYDCQTLVALAFTELDVNEHRNLQRCRDNFTRLIERNPDSVRHQRAAATIDTMLAVLKNERGAVQALVREMCASAKSAAFDFEAASNLLSLLSRLAQRDIRVELADARVEGLAMRFCTSRPITEMLAGAAGLHPAYGARIRAAGQQVQKIAQSAVTLAMRGDPSMAVRQLIVEGQTTLNAKLIEAAHHLLERHGSKMPDADKLEQDLSQLREQFGARSKPGGPSPSTRQTGSLKLKTGPA
jgi:DNA-binding response OmpR family regulator